MAFVRKFLTGVLLGLVACTSALPQSFNEYQLKAVFLFRFTQFVEWPAPGPSDSPFTICVLGQDPFERYLEETVRNESVNSRSIVVARLQSVKDLPGCQILFVSDSERARVKQIADELRGRGVLTVGDSENFAEQGGIIQFVTAENRIRLKINVEAARVANLQISSKLLRPAIIVPGGA